MGFVEGSVGILQNGTVALSGHLTDAFLKGLAEHGYVHGRNVVVEVRYAEGKLDRLPALAKEMEARGLDVFFTSPALASLPTMCTSKEFVESGCLMSYGSNYIDLVRRAGGHAARILKGARPGELPIEQPVKFELVINLELTIPRQLLLRSDQITDW
ncbi:MAG: ABC transporter substrate binding protein [Betaproteobacteria bacterium]